MSIRLHVEVCKKEGTANYGSVGATCGLEVEIDAATLADPVAAVARIRGFYSLCELAMNEELARLKGPADPADGPGPPAEAPPARRTVARPPAKRAAPAPVAEDDGDDGEPEEEEEEDDPPTDGRRLLGWARNRPTDAKGWLIGLGKRLRYPGRILDWTPVQVKTAYQSYREAHRG